MSKIISCYFTCQLKINFFGTWIAYIPTKNSFKPKNLKETPTPSVSHHPKKRITYRHTFENKLRNFRATR